MDYAFQLNWMELDEDLKEQKISEYIEKNIIDYERDFAERNNIPEGQVADMSNVVEDEENREDAERKIMSYFPIYF